VIGKNPVSILETSVSNFLSAVTAAKFWVQIINHPFQSKRKIRRKTISL
jgi:hypothetical protein